MPSDPAARAAFDEANDPFEPLNRNIFAVNKALDDALIKQVADFYRRVVPEGVRDALHNLLQNLDEPVVFVNNLLQGETSRAGTTLARFSVNSTAGLVGIRDVASDWGLPEQTGDFGQTLYVWGVSEGPYLVLPLLGPSNARDGIGMGVDGYIDPFRYVTRTQHLSHLNIARFGAAGLDERSRNIDELAEVERNAIDFYAQLRSLFRQRRAEQLGSVTVTAPAVDETLYEDPAKPPTR